MELFLPMTWDDYKARVRTADSTFSADIDEAEALASIITAITTQRAALGLSQRELAARCGVPQSSIARIESGRTTPNLSTLIKIFGQLGLRLSVTQAN